VDSAALTRLRAQLGGPRDGALLRVSIGNLLLGEGQPAAAAEEFRAAVRFDENYSAAWKLLGRALTEAGDHCAAIEAYERGIRVAEQRGDKQAAKEMTVFLRRLRKAAGEA
jgi:predicted Zn-dependent protease